jgi:hypothetical protein
LFYDSDDVVVEGASEEDKDEENGFERTQRAKTSMS